VETVLLVRHAESVYNARGLVNGDPTLPIGLTEEGERQARRLGELLAGGPLDLCVVTEFPRTQATADLALAGREVPRLVVPELNDPDYGDFEGRPLKEYRAWLAGRRSGETVPGGSESRLELVRRYARGFGIVLERPERRILAVLHSLPLSYLLGALGGRDPAPRMELVGYAELHQASAGELAGAVGRLEAWTRSPIW